MRLLKYAVPAIMLFFFVRNLVLVETDYMDSWMGGGMRMFGKIDKMLYRVSGFTVEYEGKEYFVNLRNVKAFETDDIETRILPNEKRLEKVLNKIKKLDWCYLEENDQIVLSTKEDICNRKISSSSIKNFEVYRTAYNSKNKEVRLVLINSTDN